MKIFDHKNLELYGIYGIVTIVPSICDGQLRVAYLLEAWMVQTSVLYNNEC